MSAQHISGAAPAVGASVLCDVRHEVSAGLFLAALDLLERNGTQALMRARVPARTAALFDRPPLPGAWLHRSVLDDVYTAVARDGGYEAVHQLTLEAGLHTYGPLMRRFVQGVRPDDTGPAAALLGSLDSLLRLYERGTRHAYTAFSPQSGKMDVYLVESAPRLTFIAWEALYGLALEVAGQAGSVALVQVADGGRRGRFHLLW